MLKYLFIILPVVFLLTLQEYSFSWKDSQPASSSRQKQGNTIQAPGCSTGNKTLVLDYMSKVPTYNKSVSVACYAFTAATLINAWRASQSHPASTHMVSPFQLMSEKTINTRKWAELPSWALERIIESPSSEPASFCDHHEVLNILSRKGKEFSKKLDLLASELETKPAGLYGAVRDSEPEKGAYPACFKAVAYKQFRDFFNNPRKVLRNKKLPSYTYWFFKKHNFFRHAVKFSHSFPEGAYMDYGLIYDTCRTDRMIVFREDCNTINSFLKDHFSKNYSRLPAQNLRNWLSRECPTEKTFSLFPKGTQKPKIVSRFIGTTNMSELEKEIMAIIDAGQPASLTVNAEAMEGSQNAAFQLPRVSEITGYRCKNGMIEFLVRNSYGSDCYQFTKKWECSTLGQQWLSVSVILSVSKKRNNGRIRITYLRKQ